MAGASLGERHKHNFMEGFSLCGGLGSFVVAGFCYAAYRNRENVARYLQKTESFDVGNELLKAVKSSPDCSLDYVAVRGDAKAINFPLESSNVPKARSLIQRITLHEHKVEWSRSSRLWHNTRRTISTVVNSVPFTLTSPNSKIKVNVEEALAASGLEFNNIYDKYDPVNASVSENLVQWASGEKTKGIQTVEDAILEGTTLTAVGKVKLTNGDLTIGPPSDSHQYFLSRLTLDGIIRDKKSSYKTWKFVTIVFSVTGGILLMFWLYKKWRRRREQAVDFDLNRAEMNADVQGLEAADEQNCVVCLTRRRNVVILNCGHICACRVCATQVNTCPVCRGEIVRLVPTYQS